MNDTQPNTRQQQILAYLLIHPHSSRPDLEKAIKGETVSRITVIRDLNTLTSSGWIEQSGGGRHVYYSLTPEKTILIPTDMEAYFAKEPDARSVTYPAFNFAVIERLTSLFSESELAFFEDGRKKLTSALQKTDPTILRRELERFTIELSWKSSQIEGNTYSLLETEELIKNKKEAKGHDKSEATMILNHKTAFDTILEHKETFQDVSLADIRSLHQELVKGLGVSTGIRKSGVGITGTTYKPLDDSWRIEEALTKITKQAHQVSAVPEKALIFLVMISYLQPFADGNKRTSRMISNAVLLANGYFPLSYRSVDEVEYKKALILFYEQNNLYHLKRIFLEQQRFAMENYFLS